MRFYLDSNIAFSAALKDGAVRRLVKDLHRRGHTLVMDGYVWEEARRNVMIYRSSALKDLHHLALIVEVYETATSIGLANGLKEHEIEELPDKDRPVIIAAATLGCDVLITGDRGHFGRFFRKHLLGVEIVSPVQAAEKVL